MPTRPWRKFEYVTHEIRVNTLWVDPPGTFDVVIHSKWQNATETVPLNDLGAEGWELVYVHATAGMNLALFKREVL